MTHLDWDRVRKENLEKRRGFKYSESDCVIRESEKLSPAANFPQPSESCQDWIQCGQCHVRLKRNHLNRHLSRKHSSKGHISLKGSTPRIQITTLIHEMRKLIEPFVYRMIRKEGQDPDSGTVSLKLAEQIMSKLKKID